ncbi:MAG: site-2 protease family protein [Candidatus Nanoarchaeia archaeon]
MPFEFDTNLISIIVFYSVIAVLLYVKRKKIIVQNKILFLYKTERFNNFMRNLANKWPKFWRAFGYIGIPLGFGGMAVIFGYLTYALLKMLTTPSPQATISIVLPGVRIPGASIFIPFWYGIIALFVVILVHEGSHGIVAEAFKNKIKSAGVGLLAILPLAFVEPDEKKLKRQSASTQLAIFSAGTMANFVTAAIVVVITSLLLAPAVNALIEPAGLSLRSVADNQPAALAGLQPGMIISSVNSQNISKVDDFIAYMRTIEPGQTIDIVANGTTYHITTTHNPQNASLAYLGITFEQELQVKPQIVAKYGAVLPWIPWHILQLLFWIFALNLGIGLINLLPLGPIDGGRMAKTVLEKRLKSEEKAKKLFSILSAISLVLLLANLLGPYIIKAL